MEISALTTTDIGVVAALVLVIVVLAILMFMAFRTKSDLETKTHENIDTTFRFKVKTGAERKMKIEGEAEIKTQVGVIALKDGLTDKKMKETEAHIVITTKEVAEGTEYTGGNVVTGQFRAYNKSDKTLILEGINFLPFTISPIVLSTHSSLTSVFPHVVLEKGKFVDFKVGLAMGVPRDIVLFTDMTLTTSRNSRKNTISTSK